MPVAEGVHRPELPLGIHGVPTVSAYLFHDDGGDTLVDCGIATGSDPCGALGAALEQAGSALERIARLLVTHAHIDHFGFAGEVVRRSGGELWLHEATDVDLATHADPDEAVDRREVMLADHGLHGPQLTSSSTGLRDWMPVVPFRNGARRAASIARGERARLDRVRDLVAARPSTATELTETLHPGALSGAQLHFAMAEVLADLAFHEVRGVLQRRRRPDGVYLWSST